MRCSSIEIHLLFFKDANASKYTYIFEKHKQYTYCLIIPIYKIFNFGRTYLEKGLNKTPNLFNSFFSI